MKNIFFVVFLFLPFLSYSQVVSHSFEDSVLTVFVKPSSLQSETDTIYTKEIPKYVAFVFEDIDSTNTDTYVVITLARGVQPIKTHTYENVKNKISYSYPVSYIVWEEEYFILEYNRPTIDSVETLFQKISVLPIPIIEGIQREENERLQDFINKAEIHLAAVEYYQKRFEKLKEPQENLTKKDKKKIAKIYSKVTPPNGIKIDTALFIDETEIANIHWVEYLYYLNKDSSKNCYLENLSNTVIWGFIFDSVYFNPFIDHYPHYPRFKNHPVVGITYEQVQNYCIWRGNMVSEGLNEQRKYKDYEITVHYRLPTKEEWEYAAIKDDSDKQFGGEPAMRRFSEEEKEKIYRTAKNYRKEKGYKTKEIKLEMQNYFESDTSYTKAFNYKKEYTKPYFIEEMYIDKTSFLRMQYHYPKTKQFGLDNLFGNVAEMTSEKGIAKGGSFAHTLEECAANKVQIYDSPQAWLGFRCVAEVVVRKKE
jgi:formylglycine-generating enzyme required for sulfatase activity